MSKKSRVINRGDFLLPFPDYPGNARCFVHLDARLLPYWHTLFDVCPRLLKLDPPDGLNIFRSFMTWAYRNHPPLNWTYYLSICRWLLTSAYKEQIHEEHIDAFMTAAAARWINTDDSQARGLVLVWQGSPMKVFDWKVAPRVVPGVDLEQEELPPVPWDFAWCPLTGKGGVGFRRWLPIPGL
ncbi:putative natural product biosynthesis protein [Pseudomonas sp. REP124]|uniref:putative natural product biosynthesis protein n=1 Tax=Pseudomonas sp. REP124 TaxID=2875731 RepID=UPI001CC9166B|nr:putative natural product biosynthesis protein [Pseudomonas sp. REP124]MBZ9783771.1 putative natural product biosynthesis protein [Pseudomonas sp. REP124]